jgi:hypothetical protein
MAVTYQDDYRAVVKQGPENEPIPDLKGEVIGIHLKAGTSAQQAEDIARAVNQHMSSFFLTSFKE